MGSREEAGIIYGAFLKGSRFDGWTDIFRSELWEEAFNSVNLDPKRFISRQKGFDEMLPWDHLETGVSKEFLWDEYQRSLSGVTTSDCRYGQCSECGVCDTFGLDRQMPVKSDCSEIGPLITKQTPRLESLKSRMRLRYMKITPMHYLSHLDMMRVFIRAMKRTGIPVSMSQGFHPRPKIALGPALSVGMESKCEFIDVELDNYTDRDVLMQKLNEALPTGIAITGAQYIDTKAPSLTSISDQHSYQVTIGSKSNGLFEKIGRPLKEMTSRKISEFLEKDEVVIRRGKKNRLLDIRPYLTHLALTRCEKDHLEMEMVLDVPAQGSINPREVLVSVFDFAPEEIPGIRIIRTAISKIDPLNKWDRKK